MALLSEVYWKTGQTAEELSLVAEALSQVNQTSERWWESELYRLQGELLIQQSGDTPVEVEDCFRQALDVSRSQQAKSLELRAATSLARLWQQQDKRQEAYDLLFPVFSWFTEGFDTADLIDAKTLLDELA